MSDAPQHQVFELAPAVTREFLLHHRVCPIRYLPDGHLLVLVAPGAHSDAAIEDLTCTYGVEVDVEYASWEIVERSIERVTSAQDGIELARPSGSHELDGTADVRDLASQPPVIRYVNLLIREAYVAGASDIHLEAMRDGLNARLRIDGVLQSAPPPTQGLEQAIVSRVKLLAELDIAERRRPQDGRIRVKFDDRELDLRVSTVPSVFGESVVLRLLNRTGGPAELRALGMPGVVHDAFEIAASAPHGLVLVTGPTGSGKTTTLYAALNARLSREEKIITIEDPVEYQLPGVVQIPMDRQAGLSFSTVLRSVLRQDPDVILIGEMRDQETAQIAVQAAMTGHIVFSTLHTNDALGAVARLIDLGVPDYMVATTLDLVVAQRLVRQCCQECRVEYKPTASEISLLGLAAQRMRTLLRGSGCGACRGTGFRGRVGLFECLRINEALRDAIASRAPRARLRDIALESGMWSLRDDGLMKVQSGLTTLQEVLRVVQL